MVKRLLGQWPPNKSAHRVETLDLFRENVCFHCSEPRFELMLDFIVERLQDARS